MSGGVRSSGRTAQLWVFSAAPKGGGHVGSVREDRDAEDSQRGCCFSFGCRRPRPRMPSRDWHGVVVDPKGSGLSPRA
eukprot:6881921-Pyramimonas_sp.AAC.1